MKKNIFRILSAAAAVTLVAACDLNLTPIDAVSYTEGEALIQTEKNLAAMENGILASFRSIQNGDNVLPQELMCDAFNATIDFGNNYGAIHKTDQNFTSSDYDVEAFWAHHYFAIKDFNIMISAAENVPEDLVEAVKRVKGEAHFFRAYAYLNLARQFGKAYSGSASTDLCVPLVLVYNVNERPARASVSDVYAQIKADLDEAASLLSGVKGAALSSKPTIDAVYALYARYYLDINDYANAAAYAHRVIDSRNYKLAKTIQEMNADFIEDNGTEAIMQLPMSKTEGSSYHYEEYEGLSIAYSFSFAPWVQASSDTNVEGGEVFRPYYLPTKTLVDAYSANDIRKACWFDDEMPVLLSGRYYNGAFYTFVKFRGNPNLTSSPIRNARQAPKPFKLSEMYLIAAEAELSTDAAAAKKDLNALQTARGAAATEATAETVQLEWFKETVGEGLRMSCLKRWGKGFSGRIPQAGAVNVVQQGQYFTEKVFDANSYFFQWPIPSHDLKVNKNLVQNPGYDTL